MQHILYPHPTVKLDHLGMSVYGLRIMRHMFHSQKPPFNLVDAMWSVCNKHKVHFSSMQDAIADILLSIPPHERLRLANSRDTNVILELIDRAICHAAIKASSL